MKWLALLAALAVNACAVPFSQGAKAQAHGDVCADAAQLAPPGFRLVRATVHAAGDPAPAESGLTGPFPVRFCRLEGVIEQEIGVELWLPELAAWNGRMLVGGVGGQAGNFNYRELARGVARGYVSASTDTGHKAGERNWLLGRPDRAQNYAHRANHLLAETVKQFIAARFGRQPAHSFFIGCSGGGRQALTAVQRYPLDFDGVIAGAPGVNTPAMSARRLWEMQRHSEWAALMEPADWGMVRRAAVQSCDLLDGVADGVVDDPRTCTFDPQALACRGGATKACLSAPQLAAVRQIYGPLHDEEGRRIDGGLLPTVPVSPIPLPEPFTPGPSYLATVLFAQGVHGDAAWDPRNFSLARDLPAIDRVMNLHADDPAIEPFIAGGGKLLLYQGWDDPLVSALPTLDYYAALEARFGAELPLAVRLFMVPGMDHCRGGDGADLFGGAGGDAPLVDPQHDLLSALEQWVLAGEAPVRITASRIEQGRVVRTRALCSWPGQARYAGHGSTDWAENYSCSERLY